MISGAPGMWFEAYPKSHFATVSNYINSLADYKGWSTIKTLPATLPEPSGGLLGLILKGEVYIQGPGAVVREESCVVRGPWILDC